MKTIFTIEFVETDNAMILYCIKMITSGIEDKIISKSNNKVVIDATHCDYAKLLGISQILGTTGYVKNISMNTEK
jgi:hypothetical protein